MLHFEAQSAKYECTSTDGKIVYSEKNISLQCSGRSRSFRLKSIFKPIVRAIKNLLASILLLYLNIKFLCSNRVAMQNIESFENLLKKYPESSIPSVFFKSKPNGKEPRKIVEPDDKLKSWLKQVNYLLNKTFPQWPYFIYGGIKQRNHISHAISHVNQRCVITVDIKKCFDSITVSMISSALQKHLELPEDLCTRMALKLCHDGKLAQGFPTSSFICNLYLLDPLRALHAEFNAKGLSFSGFVDDLAISGNIETKKEQAQIIDRIFIVLRKYKLKLNKDGKIKVMPHNKTQEICKLKVNKQLTITRGYRDKVFRLIANNQIEEVAVEEIEGTISYWRNINPKLAGQLRKYALSRGVIQA